MLCPAHFLGVKCPLAQPPASIFSLASSIDFSSLRESAVSSAGWFRKLQPVSPRIVRVKSLDAAERLVPRASHSSAAKPLEKLLDVIDGKRRMRLGSWPKILLDANVQLPRAHLKPASASRAQRLGLFNLVESEQPSEKFARCLFTPVRRRNLHMVDFDAQDPR